MLIYFHHHKFNYNKGQLAPLFIVFLVVLIIMAMVMVNLSKVAFVKTDSSNAVDAGALAAGSVMAILFNYVAKTNKGMIDSYNAFMATITISFTLAGITLAAAMLEASDALAAGTLGAAEACIEPCAAVADAAIAGAAALAAIGGMSSGLISFEIKIAAIAATITAFYGKQLATYSTVRDQGDKSWSEAIKTGHKFSFINSGISSKLKQGSGPTNNFRESFKQFLDSIGDGLEYQYSWNDGEGRDHYVRSIMSIAKVKKYKLQVTIMPLAAELLTLGACIALSELARDSLQTAVYAYENAQSLSATACGCQICCETTPCEECECCACCACWTATCALAVAAFNIGNAAVGVAMGLMTAIFPLMAAALAGLAPGPIIISESVGDASPYIICWIVDILHDRRVTAYTTQHHQGQEQVSGLLWQARYPDIKSYSIVSFQGNGSIYPPKWNFDASIIETDTLQ